MRFTALSRCSEVWYVHCSALLFITKTSYFIREYVQSRVFQNLATIFGLKASRSKSSFSSVLKPYDYRGGLFQKIIKAQTFDRVNPWFFFLLLLWCLNKNVGNFYQWIFQWFFVNIFEVIAAQCYRMVNLRL